MCKRLGPVWVRRSKLSIRYYYEIMNMKCIDSFKYQLAASRLLDKYTDKQLRNVKHP